MRPQILIALIACTTALPSMITAMPPNPMDPSSISGAATSGNANARANANLHPVDDRGDGDFEGDTMSEEAVAYRRRVSRARAGAGAGIPSGHSRAIFNAAFRPSPEDVPQQQQQQRGRDGDRVATATNTSEEDRLVDELLNSFLTVGRAIEGEDEAPATAAAQPRVTVEQQQQQQPRRSSQQVRGDARLQHDAARLPPRPQAPSSPPAAAHAQVPVVDPSAAALHLRTMLHRHHDVTARERITRALHIAPYPSSYFHKTSGTHSLTKLAKSTSPPSAVDMTVTHHYATPRRVTLKWKLRDPDAVMHARSAEALLLVGYEGAHSRAPMDEWRAPSLMDDIVFEVAEFVCGVYAAALSKQMRIND